MHKRCQRTEIFPTPYWADGDDDDDVHGDKDDVHDVHDEDVFDETVERRMLAISVMLMITMMMTMPMMMTIV